ncbi:MAG: CPBP family intramembrane metalloprotease [Clostridia bacterium]|nr:CPBP family intramembrane metalloprotease [Clostridia bacterium]
MKKKRELTIEESAHRERLRDVYNGIFIVTVFVWVLNFALGGLASLVSPHLNYYIATTFTVLAKSIATALPFLVFRKLCRDPLSPVFTETPRSEHPVVRCIFGCLATAGLTLASMGLMAWLLSFLEGNGVHTNVVPPSLGNTGMETVFYIILSSVLYSFSYEIAFRGIAIRAMGQENRLGAVFVSGIAYALSDGDPYGIVVRLSIGFLLGWFYLRIRSVWCCMVLQAASQVIVSLWWVFLQNREFTAYINFLILSGLVLGVAAAFFLFYPRRDPDPQTTPNSIALKEVFSSFGIYLMVAMVAFNMLIFTFSTDPDPHDPLLQPMEEEDKTPPLQFDQDE